MKTWGERLPVAASSALELREAWRKDPISRDK